MHVLRDGTRSFKRGPPEREQPSAISTCLAPAPAPRTINPRPSPLLPSFRAPEILPRKDKSQAYIHPDSIVSTKTKEGLFYRNYHIPKSVPLAAELRIRSAPEIIYRVREDIPLNEPSLRPPLGLPDGTSIEQPTRSGMADINIAVIGRAGVGKSTLIQRALGLKALPTSIASSLRMSVDRIESVVSLVELDLESFDTSGDSEIRWPKQINGHIVPRMDGALLLYDVMNRESVVELPQTLNGLVHSAMPAILVSCKCDNPENSRQINVENMEEACASCVEAVKTAENAPESARLCLSSMLRAIMANRKLSAKTSSGSAESQARRRATSGTPLDHPCDPSAPLSHNSKHSRASSGFSLLRVYPSSAQAPSRVSTNGRANLLISLPSPRSAPPLSSHPMFRNDSFNSTESSIRLTGPKSRSPLPSPRPREAVDNSSREMDESDLDSASFRYSDDIPILQRNDDGFFDKHAKVAGVTFSELVDRLLDQYMTRADSNFSDIFLCLYRKFAAPGELFDAIIERLEHIADDRNIHYLTRTTTQLRIITVVAKWVTNYPGDFANSITNSKLDAFVGQLAGDPVFAAAAQEMRMQLKSRVFVDDDTGWARTDADVEQEAANFAYGSSTSSPTRTGTDTKPAFEDEINNFHIDDGCSEDMARQDSRGDSLVSDPGSSTRSLSPSFHTVEDYEREAATMIPKGALPLTKFRYHMFMDMSVDDFADEMTRIDWVMFSSIRLRDLIRHVSLPLEQKEKMTNVHRMINHFNHIAKWVANIILMRDHAKHRAQLLEKFMKIALKLRQLNNYNGLAAVLAGINGSSIHRLTQTRNLVPADVQKRFARLVILMGTQKSHFAYRLAWENSPLPRIPFIPLHRRDLVSAEQGSRTFVGANGDRINWKKFEILSEVILPIMKSQALPYPNLSRHEGARELILDCRISLDDEEVYQRSLQLESSSGAVDVGKKRFPWFQKDK
ncbi:hypothetical protein LZ554_006033 [Drepanopeziza brunnea f. sp. 'monogermtubi']|nr:hypothetical protein LZ554_006033 [Drepanopeziza brunnea f. sp. 'monogermtubi']